MPDGFDPHVELERILTLKDLMTECRKRTPVILQRIDDMLNDPELSPGMVLAVSEMVLNRGFGKPRQHVVMTNEQTSDDRVKIYLPDNGRQSQPVGRIIDIEGKDYANPTKSTS